MYPPALIAEPPPGLEALTTARRSGDEGIDQVLDALAAEDVALLEQLVDYQTVECVTEVLGIGAPPMCEAGEAPGTELEVLGMSSCEGYFVRRTDIGESLALIADGDWALYAATLVDEPIPDAEGFAPGTRVAVVVDTARTDSLRMMALFFSDLGLNYIRHGCGQPDPYLLLEPATRPDLLLAPLP